jgi:hypothetical protein
VTTNLTKSYLTKEALSDFDRDGYLIVRDFFSSDEVLAFRKKIEILKDENLKKGIRVPVDPLVPGLTWFLGDLLSQDGLDKLVFDKRILSVARQILGRDLVYWGDSTFQIGKGYRGFHKDSVDRSNPDGEDWKSYYDIIRMGIYLQDHQHYSGGLKIRKGSHNFSDLKSGKIIDVPSLPRDLIIWKLTTTHSGNAVKCRFFPFIPLQNRIENRLPSFLQLPEEKERNTIILTYSRPGPHLERYMKWCVDRGDYHEHWRHSRYDAEIQNLCDENGIKFVRPISDFGSKFKI